MKIANATSALITTLGIVGCGAYIFCNLFKYLQLYLYGNITFLGTIIGIIR